MGVYIKGLQAEKVEAIFKMLGLSIKDGDIIEVTEPHGRLIDADKVKEKMIPLSFSVQNWISEVDLCYVPTVIEGSEHDK